jgi:thiamine biosynthesis lipoprotein
MPAPAAHEWDLWSTTARLVVTEPSRLDEARELAIRQLALVELAASRFRADSELLTLGRDGDGGVRVSATLADLLREALRAAERSDGAVDPTVGSALVDLGYDRDLDLVRLDDSPLRVVVQRVPGWRSLRLEGDRLFRPHGVQLDLGATAKAVAADRVAALIADRLGTGVLISLGGDIATAGAAPEPGWQILVQDLPTDPECRVTLSAGAAVATSSTVRRTWQRAGRSYHHVVDPETSQPVRSGWRSVTAIAPTCAEANTITTGALVKGTSAVAWIRSLGRPARLVPHVGNVILLNGWPEEQAA